MESQIDQSGDCDDSEQSKKSACGARTFFKCPPGALRVQVAGGFKDEEADGSENRGAGGVEDAFEHVNAKTVRERDFVFTRDQQRTYRFGRSAQNE